MAVNKYNAAVTMGMLILTAGQSMAEPLGNNHQLEGSGTEVILQASNTPDDFNHPGPNYNIFDPTQTNDHAIYYSAGDWLRDPEIDLFLDGIVDPVGSYGMVIGNFDFDYPEDYDRQVKNLQEYMLAPAYDAGINADSLVSATLTFVVDRVIDMSLQGCTDCRAPKWMYINVFAGDGFLTSIGDAQIDFDRCDRRSPETWDVIVHLVSDRGFRLTDDEIIFYNGKITFEIDVTEEVHDLLAAGEAFAGFCMAASHDGDFTMTSIDGGVYPGTALPTLKLVSWNSTEQPSTTQYQYRSIKDPTWQNYAIGDLNQDGNVNQADREYFETCYALQQDGSKNEKAIECTNADLNRDGIIDVNDLILFRSLFNK